MCLCPCPPLNISPKSPPLFPSFHCFPLRELQLKVLERSEKGSAHTPQQRSVPPVSLEEQAEQFVQNFCPQFLQGLGQCCGWQQTFLSPQCTGCTGQSTTGAVTGVTPRFSVTPVSFPAERGKSHCFGTVVTQGQMLSSASVLQQMLFPLYPLFLSHLHPIPIYFTGTFQGRDTLVLKVNFWGGVSK